MHIIYGLGNQDLSLLKTKHNLGRLVVEQIAQNLGLSFKNENGLFTAKTDLSLNFVVLAYSGGYMNNSGQNLQSFISFYKPSELTLWIIQDDSDQEEGFSKQVFGGGSGGHNGIISVYKYLLNWPLEQKDVLRLKVGIREVHNKQKALEFVLKPISKLDLELIKETAVEVVNLLTKN
jgi:peptidyl-tRNA hydrolase, PTH1 family